MILRSASGAGLLAAFHLLLASVEVVRASGAKDEWRPIAAEDLAMREDPSRPGVEAVVLYREHHTDDVQDFTSIYRRIKVLTVRGRDRANVEIPYLKGFERVGDIRARTIHADGSVVAFAGSVYDKSVVKGRGLQLAAKAFTLPDVQVGSIVEYRFKIQRDRSILLLPTAWVIAEDLPARRARFSILPRRGVSLYWLSQGLPKETVPKRQPDGSYAVEVDDLRAFDTEELAPPEHVLKGSIVFYQSGMLPEPDEFWKEEGKSWAGIVERFIGKRRRIADEAARQIAVGDDEERMLRKLYARAQQVRNLRFEREKSATEVEREKRKENGNVEDVLDRGYGWPHEIDRLFVALARAAGLDASIVRVATRDDAFFQPKLLVSGQLDGEIAFVRLAAGDLWLDPGCRFCPFGLLPWEKTGVDGLRLDARGGVFVKTPKPLSCDGEVARSARLEMSESGLVKGSLRAAFRGREALDRRLDAVNQDEVARKKSLEEEAKGWLPEGAEVEVVRSSGWDVSDGALEVDLSVHLPDLASTTGRRLVVPLGLFRARNSRVFEHAKRVHPLYFHAPFQEVDEVSLTLPAGYQVESLPAETKLSPGFASYARSVTGDPGTVTLRRRFQIDVYRGTVDTYPELRRFYASVRSSDEQQVVLHAPDAR